VVERIIPGHLVGFGSVKNMERLEQYCDNGFTDAGMTEIRDKNMPRVAECDKLCAELSGGVVVWKKKALGVRAENLKVNKFLRIYRIAFRTIPSRLMNFKM
ncbi:hypothetical protein, partial [Halomonas sp. PAR8]|uniref:hypothetical protein n=1 Tax=Halomonas sp. PAR8 TaxID=3075515 RepID=UPI0028844EDD